MSIDEWIQSRTRRAPLGAQATKVLQVLTSQPHFASYSAAREVADQAGVNISTVTRTAQAIGFAGWPALQLELRNRYLASLSASDILSEHDAETADPITAALQRDAANLQLVARTVDREEVRAIAQAIGHEGRTLVIGSGSYLAPAVMLGHIGALMGLDMEWEPIGGTHRAMKVDRLNPGDCLVVFNVWRLPREILALTRLAQEAGVTTCIVTDRRSSPLADAADHVVVVPSEGAASFPSMTPAIAIVHALLAQLLKDNAARFADRPSRAEDVWRALDLMVDQPE